MTPDLILPFEGVLPAFASPPVHCGRASTVIGAVTLGAGAWLGAGSVIRADGEAVTIGRDFHLGARGTVHIATDTLSTRVGDRVVAGRNAVIHACTLGSDVVIEDDAVILDGATVGDRVLIEAGAVVVPRAELEPGHVYGGCPARKRGPVTPETLAARAAALREAAVGHDARESDGDRADAMPRRGGNAFVAHTARLTGNVTLGADATVLFSCRLEARSGSIVLGAGSNVQDNSAIRATGSGVVIGRDTVIAHNVRMEDCRIGAGSLIGIGCRIAPGTVIADDVLLAAGAATEPGQLLGSGHLWGGRPARILSALDDEKRTMIRRIAEGYRVLGRTYGRMQETIGEV